MPVALVDFACGQSASNLWIGRVALLAVDPSAADEDVPRDLVHLVLGQHLPDSIIQVVELLHNGGLCHEGI